MAGGRARGAWAAATLLAAFLLCWPAALNGSPFVYFDTEAYLVGGHAVLRHLAGLDLGGVVAGPGEQTGALLNGGRSPVYGLALRLLAAGGSFWPVAFVQALAGSWLVAAAVRALAPARPLLLFGAAIVGLAAASSLPFYATFIMPDVLTGYLILAIGLLASGRLGTVERFGLVVFATFALAAHGSNLPVALTALVMLVSLGLWIGLDRPTLVRRGVWLTAPLVLSVALGGLGAAVVTATAGQPALRPPFLMARVLADGPGRTYLARACHQDDARFELCRHVGKPLDDTVAILWSGDPRVGVFSVTDLAGRRRLTAQERDFVIAAVLSDPLGQVKASVRNSLRQLTAFDVRSDLGLMRRAWDEMAMTRKFPAAAPAATASRAYQETFPFRPFDQLQAVVVAASLLLLAIRCAQPDMIAAVVGQGDAEKRILLGLTIGLLVVLLANAVVCGSLSAPASRYQARTIWLQPLWTLLLFAKAGLTARRRQP